MVLPTVDSVQDLDLFVCKSLSWNNHIQDKLAKCNKIFYFLKRHIPFSTHVHRKKMLYQSLLLSVILYGYSAWNASISSLKSLESFQKKVLHWILPSLDYVSALQSLDVLPICFQLIKIDLILLWKIQHNQIDIHHKLSFSQQQTRSQARCLFVVPAT